MQASMGVIRLCSTHDRCFFSAAFHERPGFFPLQCAETTESNAGKMRRQEVAAGRAEAGGALPAEVESRLLVRAVRSSKLPSLTAEDARLFSDLVGDVWPGVAAGGGDDAELREALQASIVAEHLTEESEQVRSCAEQSLFSYRCTLWSY